MSIHASLHLMLITHLYCRLFLCLILLYSYFFSLFASLVCQKVMGLYFTQYPNELHGNILELGSGVGLGGILSLLINNTMNSHDNDDERKEEKSSSMTLTDINDDVLHMLRQNVTNLLYTTDDIFIQKLDWFDYLDNSIQRRRDRDENESDEDDERYDTIIASDCAYLHQQVVPLSNTILYQDYYQRRIAASCTCLLRTIEEWCMN